jgi:deoxyribodipyrimidine photo-lyase
MKNINIHWFRNDLRLSDNLSFTNACKAKNLLSIFIFNEEDNIGSASKIWLHHSLNSLNDSLDNKLNIYIGKPQNIFEQLIRQYNIEKIYWNKIYEPKSLKLDKEIENTKVIILVCCGILLKLLKMIKHHIKYILHFIAKQ